MPKWKTTSKAPADGRSGQIIQFRADDSLIAQLTIVSERLRTPMGVLARQWVAERLAKELREHQDSLELWREKRWNEISRKLRTEMEQGPFQILYLVPTSEGQEVELAKARSIESLLAPAERLDGRFISRFNMHGLITEKKFGDSEKANAYVQLFRNGRVESVRILQESDQERALYGDSIDSDVVNSVRSFGLALQQLNIPLPITVFLEFHGVAGYRLRTVNYNAPTTPMQYNDLSLPPVMISDWKQLENITSLASLLKPSLNILWNEAGFESSLSFNKDGVWSNAYAQRRYRI